MELQSCNICNVTNVEETFSLFTSEQIDKVISDIFAGITNIKNLDLGVYEKVAEKLTKGVYKGFGKDIVGVEFGTPDYNMLKSLRENVYHFSAAKSYQSTKQISALLTNEKGLASYSEFKKEAVKLFETYNNHHLNVEYNSAVAQSRAASLWMDIEKDKSIYKQLRYETIGDARVRDEHKQLDGIIKGVDDPFWNRNYPPLSWNCRCTVVQTFGEKETDLSTRKEPTKKEIPEAFRFNSGKDKIIFGKAHPYFDVPKDDKELALKNFNLPIPR